MVKPRRTRCTDFLVTAKTIKVHCQLTSSHCSKARVSGVRRIHRSELGFVSAQGGGGETGTRGGRRRRERPRSGPTTGTWTPRDDFSGGLSPRWSKRVRSNARVTKRDSGTGQTHEVTSARSRKRAHK